MPRLGIGVVALVVLTMFNPTSPQQGCQGAVKALIFRATQTLKKQLREYL